MEITYLSRSEVYQPRAPLGGDADESFAKCSSDFSLVRTLVLSSMYIKALTKMTMASWWID